MLFRGLLSLLAVEAGALYAHSLRPGLCALLAMVQVALIRLHCVGKPAGAATERHSGMGPPRQLCSPDLAPRGFVRQCTHSTDRQLIAGRRLA